MSSPQPGPVDTTGAAPGAVPDGAVTGEPLPGEQAPAPVPARRPWSPWTELRGDLRTVAVVVAVLAVAGLLAGLLWWGIAPRAHFRITADGPSAIGNPSEELLAGDDVVYALVLAGLGIAAGVVLWFRRSFRGAAALVALAVGMVAAGAGAWLIGALLAPSPGKTALTRVGVVVTTGLDLGSWPALAVGPFFAVLAYLLAAVLDGTDDLGRDAMERPPFRDPR